MEIFWSSPMPARRGYSRRSTRAPPLPPRFAPPTIPRASRRRPATALIGWAAVLAASMLGWLALAPDAPRHVVPTFGAGLAALLGAWVFQRRAAAHGITISLAVGACGFAALAGWLAVPRRPGIGQRHVGAVGVRGRRIGGVTRLRSCRNDYACGVRGVGVGGGTDARCGAAVVARRGDRTGPGRRVAGRVVGGAAAGRPCVVGPGSRGRRPDCPDADRAPATHRRGGDGGGRDSAGLSGHRHGHAAISRLDRDARRGAASQLLRMRVHAERRRAAALAIGAALVSTTARHAARRLAWPAALAVRSAGRGFRGGNPAGRSKTWCPGRCVRRIASAAEFAAAAAIAPLGCWAAACSARCVN